MQSLQAGNMSMLRAGVSCPLPSGGRIALEAEENFSGLVMARPTIVDVPAGTNLAEPVEFQTMVDRCGPTEIRGRLIDGSDTMHREVTATVQIEPVDVNVVFIVSAKIYIQPAILRTDQVTTENPIMVPGTFTADRQRLILTFPNELEFDPVIILPDETRVVADYEPDTGHASFSLSAQIDETVPFITGSSIEMDLDTRNEIESFGRNGPWNRRFGGSASRTGTDPWRFKAAFTGEARLQGGTFEDRLIGIELEFALIEPVRPPRNCNQEPFYNSPPYVP